VSFAESAYDYLSREFDYQIKEPTPLIFYRTHSEFQQTNVISNYIPEGTGAFATPLRNRMVMPVDLPDDELMELMLHELTHIFQYHVLYGGSTGRGLTQIAPQYINEGMASYFAQDESARDKMYLRDAVVNDSLPPITADFQGYFAYRYGHAFFDFIEERWGKEGVQEFLIELRNTLGARVGPAVERTFFMSAEDFNADFRRWLRQKYLPELVATGEPGDFGRPFRVKQRRNMWLASPAASPSGDLVAAIMQDGRDTDVVLLDARSRELLKNLTKGYTSDYQYIIAQEVGQLGRKMGRDLSFSPDGNTLAVFARHEGERELLLIDVLKGKVRRRLAISVDQPLAPSFHPDGSRVIFAGHRGGQFDIFEVVLDSGEIVQLTEDAIFDGAPAYSPDGESVVFVSTIGDFDKLFRIARDRPAERFQITHGESDENDPVYSPDGTKIYFTSDRTGANNIFSLEPETGEIVQYTNAVTGCFMPTILANPTGPNSLVYTAFWKGAHDIYRMDLGDPITEPIVFETKEVAATPRSLSAQDLPQFEPAIEVAIDEANVEPYGGKKFFLENFFGGTIGISDDQTFIAALGVSFTDYLGDRRIVGYFQSVESFRNFDVRYLNQTKRLQRMYRLYDDEDFFVFLDNDLTLEQVSIFQETGATASVIYPIDFNRRVEVGVGYARRELDFVIQIGLPLEDAIAAGELDDLIERFGLEGLTPEQQAEVLRPFTGDPVPVPVVNPRTDDYPFVQASFIGDSTVFTSYGPHSGQRYRLSASYAANTDTGEDDSSTLFSSLSLDYRGYIPLTRRMEIAVRGYGYTTSGDFATPVYFGGLDTVRGFDFRSVVGDEGFFSNIELRFPLLDQIAVGGFGFQGIRGFLFLDVAGARFSELQPNWDCWDSEDDRLQDCVSSYGFGFSLNLFGLPMNWNFSKQWDFDKTLTDGFDTSFWIGYKF
ncbi:MAG: hypothetical protein R3244_06910, partial [Thermoanaerobaculia bacterium]|nr:hypothetical protein [Thermoanaerobaculia bacterium]